MNRNCTMNTTVLKNRAIYTLIQSVHCLYTQFSLHANLLLTNSFLCEGRTATYLLLSAILFSLSVSTIVHSGWREAWRTYEQTDRDKRCCEGRWGRDVASLQTEGSTGLMKEWERETYTVKTYKLFLKESSQFWGQFFTSNNFSHWYLPWRTARHVCFLLPLLPHHVGCHLGDSNWTFTILAIMRDLWRTAWGLPWSWGRSHKSGGGGWVKQPPLHSCIVRLCWSASTFSEL